MRPLIQLITAVAFLLTSLGSLPTYAQDFSVNKLPVPGQMMSLSSGFVPVLIRGVRIYPDKPLNFDFILDSGNDTTDQKELKEEGERMVKYFLATLTVPAKDLWVNLSPYEKDRIIPNELGQTVLGRDMLAQDYVLKQLTASLIYPEKGLGKEFWDKVYTQAREKFGKINIPVNTFNKVWIIPASAEVFEKDNAVYVTKARLKVMLDEDYLALGKNKRTSLNLSRNTHVLASQVVREIVIPALEKEVNEGKNFGPLRQIYYAAILAKWYRQTITKTLLSQVYVGKNRIKGIDLQDKTLKEQIYERYIRAYKKGVFNYIKEDLDSTTGQNVTRKYFSGGLTNMAMVGIPLSHAKTLGVSVGSDYAMKVELSSVPSAEEARRSSSENSTPVYINLKTRHQKLIGTIEKIEGAIDQLRAMHWFEDLETAKTLKSQWKDRRKEVIEGSPKGEKLASGNSAKKDGDTAAEVNKEMQLIRPETQDGLSPQLLAEKAFEYQRTIVDNELGEIYRYAQKNGIQLPWITVRDLENDKNRENLEKYSEVVKQMLKELGSKFNQHFPELPQTLRTQEDLYAFSEWVLNLLGEIGLPVKGQKFLGVNQRSMEDAVEWVKKNKPAAYQQAEEYVKELGLKSLESMQTDLGIRKTLTLLNLSGAGWTDYFFNASRQLMLDHPEVYPAQEQEIIIYTIDFELRRNIIKYKERFFRDSFFHYISGIKHTSAASYLGFTGVVTLSAAYSESRAIGQGEQAYHYNPLITLLAIVHELRHHSFRLKISTLDKAPSYQRNSNIKTGSNIVEEETVVLETDAVLRMLAEHLKDKRDLSYSLLYFFSNLFTTPFFPSLTDGDYGFQWPQSGSPIIYDSDRLKVLGIILYEWQLQHGHVPLRDLNGDLLTKVVDDLLRERIVGQGDQKIIDDYLKYVHGVYATHNTTPSIAQFIVQQDGWLQGVTRIETLLPAPQSVGSVNLTNLFYRHTSLRQNLISEIDQGIYEFSRDSGGALLHEPFTRQDLERLQKCLAVLKNGYHSPEVTESHEYEVETLHERIENILGQKQDGHNIENEVAGEILRKEGLVVRESSSRLIEEAHLVLTKEDPHGINAQLKENILLLLQDEATHEVYGVLSYKEEGDGVATIENFALSHDLGEMRTHAAKVWMKGIDQFFKKIGIRLLRFPYSVKHNNDLTVSMDFRQRGLSWVHFIDHSLEEQYEQSPRKPYLLLHYNGYPEDKWIKPRLPREDRILTELQQTSNELTHLWQQQSQTMGKRRDDVWVYNEFDKEAAKKDLPVIAQTCLPDDKILQMGQLDEDYFWNGRMADHILPRLNDKGHLYIVGKDKDSYKDLEESSRFNYLNGKAYALPLIILPQSIDVVILPLPSGINITPDREMRLQEILLEINRVLKPGGRIIIKGHPDSFLELQYYGQGILDNGRYQVNGIKGVINSYEWRSFTKTDPVLIGTQQGPGGIDLTSDKSIQVKGDGASRINFHMDSAMLAKLQSSQGFVPVIINIQPINNLQEFLSPKLNS